MKSYTNGFVMHFRIFRIKHNILLREIAKEAKISPQRISEIELVRSVAGEQVKAQLAHALEAVLLRREAENIAAMEAYRREKEHLFDEVAEREVRQNE